MEVRVHKMRYDDEERISWSGRMCKKVSQLLPAGVAWLLLVGCSVAFFALVAPTLWRDEVWGNRGVVVIVIDGLLFILVLSNLIMAMCLDPGVHPIATISEEQSNSEDFRSPLYKNVVINGISVRMKWCVTCKFYRPPRASHCSVCNRCIDNFDHHCPWVHNCVGCRNYRYFFFFLLFLSIHMMFVGVVCTTYLIQRASRWDRKPVESMDPSFLCSVVLLILTILLAIPVVGLTLFHVVLVLRGRSTNEQVTGKFQSGFNPFTKGWHRNCLHTLCHSQSPSFEGYSIHRKMKGNGSEKEKKKKQTSIGMGDETSVLYVPEGGGKEGHIRLKQVKGSDSDSVGTALSLARQPSLGPPPSGSTCNLYDERGSVRVVSPDVSAAYEASVAEAMAGSKAISPSESGERIGLVNGDRRKKPLAFSDAMRIHDQFNSPTKAVNL